MVDPLSAVASAVQIAAFAGSLVKYLSRFMERMGTVEGSIRELYDEVCLFKSVVDGLQNMLQSKPAQSLSRETGHLDQICAILKACHRSLEDLKQALPPIKDDLTSLGRFKLTVTSFLKEDRLKEIIHHVTSSTRLLQLSLQVLSICEAWANRKSQDIIISEMRELRRAIRAEGCLSGRITGRVESPQRELPAIGGRRPCTPPPEDEMMSGLDKTQILGWCETVDCIDAVVSFSTFEDVKNNHLSTVSSSLLMNSSTIHIRTSETDTHEFDDEIIVEPLLSTLRYSLVENQKTVEILRGNQIYFQAAVWQRDGIKTCRRLHNGTAEQNLQDDAVGCIISPRDMEEVLADILLDCDIAQTNHEAEEILTKLLRQANERLDTNDPDRIWRIQHKLGKVNARQGDSCNALRNLEGAFVGRANAEPHQTHLVIESAKTLIETYHKFQRINDARGVQLWFEEHFPGESCGDDSSLPRPPPRSMSVGSELSGPLKWSQEQGFDINTPSFKFDTCDSSGKAPIHLAIQLQNVEVLQIMLQHIRNIEQPDSTGATPLLLAAITRNKRLVEALLERGANPNAIDQSQRTALHKCQSKSGGIQVAKLILNRCPHQLNRVDCFGKTALYMACEQGNEIMAAFLLSRGANPNPSPNGDGLGQYVPLVSAIDAVAQSSATIYLVQLLLKHGADARRRDGSGRTAFEAASNAGLAAKEIKKLLGEQPFKRPSMSSIPDSLNTVESSLTNDEAVPVNSSKPWSTRTWLRRMVSSKLIDEGG